MSGSYEQCSRCRQVSMVRYLGTELCQRHWNEYCEQQDSEEEKQRVSRVNEMRRLRRVNRARAARRCGLR